jgi:hypothetical protein
MNMKLILSPEGKNIVCGAQEHGTENPITLKVKEN